MSDQTLTWPEMLLLYSMTKQPLVMEKIPEGCCRIVDCDHPQHGLTKDYPHVVVTVDRKDQRTARLSELPESTRNNWFTAENSYGHGENEIGSFRYIKNGLTIAIIPNPSIEDLQKLIDTFGPIEISKDAKNVLIIYLNSGNS